MITVRLNTFETNSSSAHVLTVIDDKAFEEFKNGNLIISTNDAEAYTFDEWANKLVECAKMRNGWADDHLNMLKEEYADVTEAEIGDKLLSWSDDGILSEGFKQWHKEWLGLGKRKEYPYNTYKDLIESQYKDGTRCKIPTVDRLKEIFKLCYGQHAYCDGHMGGYDYDDIDGITSDESSFFGSCYSLLDDGFIIGQKGLSNCPMDCPPEIKKLNKHAYQIEYWTFG